jgi:Flp pilus assembly protein TadG
VTIATLMGRLTAACMRWPRGSSFARREDGGAALEFAIVAAPAIALILAILQTALAYFAGQILETAVVESSRLVLTGQASSNGWNQSQFQTQVCNNISALFSCGGIMVDVTTADTFSDANTSMPTLTFDANGNVNNSWNYTIGGPGDIVVMRVLYQWPVFLGPLGLSLSNESNGNMLLMATAVFKNEP